MNKHGMKATGGRRKLLLATATKRGFFYRGKQLLAATA
jgi:hypothetical protein